MDRLITTSELAALIKRKPATIARNWRLWHNFGFPPPISAPPHTGRLLWLESQIISYMAKLGTPIANDVQTPKPKIKIINETSANLDSDEFLGLINF